MARRGFPLPPTAAHPESGSLILEPLISFISSQAIDVVWRHPPGEVGSAAGFRESSFQHGLWAEANKAVGYTPVQICIDATA